MMGKTHMLGGVLAGLVTISIMGTTGPAEIGVGMACAVGGSLVPDIDHPNAKISRMNLFFSALSHGVCSLTNHRHFCHTILFMALIGALWVGLFRGVGSWVSPYINQWLITMAHSTGLPLFRSIAKIDIASYMMMGCIFLLVGMLSHLILDTCNPQGIMWLYPFNKKRISILPITTGSVGEILFNVGLCVAIVAWLLLWANQAGLIEKLL